MNYFDLGHEELTMARDSLRDEIAFLQPHVAGLEEEYHQAQKDLIERELRLIVVERCLAKLAGDSDALDTPAVILT